MTKRILIVEDQEDNRTILRDILITLGHDLIEAFNGEDAVSGCLRRQALLSAPAPGQGEFLTDATG